MLERIEKDFMAHIQATPVATRLRVIGQLPTFTEDDLVRQFGNDAPAVYVSAGNVEFQGENIIYTAGVLCVAQNASSYAGPRRHDARQGEGAATSPLIGLFEIIEFLLPHLHQAKIAGANWNVLGAGELLDNEKLFKQGIYASVIRLRTNALTLGPTVDESTLPNFEQFKAGWDLGPEPDGQLEAEDDLEIPQ